MTRVLFLTESFHPVLGGGEQHIRDLARRLVARGLEATVLTRRTDAAWPAEERLDGVRVIRVGPSGPGRSGKYAMLPRAIAALAWESATFDVVVARGTRVLGLPALVAGRALGKAVVLQPELNGEMSGEVYTWGTPLDKAPWRGVVRTGVRVRNLLMRDADAFVAMSRRIADEFRAAGVRQDRIALIPHGIDIARFSPASPAERRAAREALGLPSAAALLVYTGRLLRGKGLETLLEAVASVAAAHPAVHLVLVGSGEGQSLSVEAGLRAMAASPGLSGRVTFTGRVTNVEDYLRAADAFVFPSVFEALGLSLLEAAACGLPAVGSRTGGIVDAIEDGASGLLVAPGDAADLARAMARIVSDPALRTHMGERARAIAVRRFDAEASAAGYERLFSEISPGLRRASRRGDAARAGAAPRRRTGSPA